VKYTTFLVICAIILGFGAARQETTYHDPYTVIAAALDGPQRVISITMKILEDVRIDKLVLTDPEGRVFTVNPERSVLAAGMQPTYEFIVESGQNFAVGKYNLLMVGQMTAHNQSLSHEVELEVK
jgi:hypothetical protein